jgi:hypothetical protein
MTITFSSRKLKGKHKMNIKLILLSDAIKNETFINHCNSQVLENTLPSLGDSFIESTKI